MKHLKAIQMAAPREMLMFGIPGDILLSELRLTGLWWLEGSTGARRKFHQGCTPRQERRFQCWFGWPSGAVGSLGFSPSSLHIPTSRKHTQRQGREEVPAERNPESLEDAVRLGRGIKGEFGTSSNPSPIRSDEEFHRNRYANREF